VARNRPRQLSPSGPLGTGSRPLPPGNPCLPRLWAKGPAAKDLRPDLSSPPAPGSALATRRGNGVLPRRGSACSDGPSAALGLRAASAGAAPRPGGFSRGLDRLRPRRRRRAPGKYRTGRPGRGADAGPGTGMRPVPRPRAPARHGPCPPHG